jgi:4-amino-4-deoxy-L-arabinose transferase-like glycosyltransferase
MNRISMKTINNSRNYDYKLILLFFFTAFFMFFNLWTGSLRPWDEGWYGEVAREIVEDNQGWLTLHYNHDVFSKSHLFSFG